MADFAARSTSSGCSELKSKNNTISAVFEIVVRQGSGLRAIRFRGCVGQIGEQFGFRRFGGDNGVRVLGVDGNDSCFLPSSRIVKSEAFRSLTNLSSLSLTTTLTRTISVEVRSVNCPSPAPFWTSLAGACLGSRGLGRHIERHQADQENE